MAAGYLRTRRGVVTAAVEDLRTLSACVRCPGITWPRWGLSVTTPADEVTLLRQLVAPGRLLSPAARGYALSLLENVTPSQRWGVSAGVPAGVTVALKNGWLPLNKAATNWARAPDYNCPGR